MTTAIIGTGNIGGTLARIWSAAVRPLSSRLRTKRMQQRSRKS